MAAAGMESDMSNDEKLAMLQELGPEFDFDTLRTILEQSQWDLNQATALVLGGDQPIPLNTSQGGGIPEIDISGDNDELSRAIEASRMTGLRRGLDRTISIEDGKMNVKVDKVERAGTSNTNDRPSPPILLDEMMDENPWSKLLESHNHGRTSPPPHGSTTRERSPPPDLDAMMDNVTNNRKAQTNNLTRRPIRSTGEGTSATMSNGPERNLQFAIEYNGRVVPFNVQDSDTVGELRKRAFMTFKGKTNAVSDLNETAPEEFKLFGWSSMNETEESSTPPADDVSLKNLSLTKRTDLYVVWDKDDDGEDSESTPFQLSIRHVETGRKHNVFVRSNETFSDVKKTVHGLTDVPPSKQLWIGLPPDVTEKKLMMECGFDRPVHEVTVERNPIPDTNSNFDGPSSSHEVDSPNTSGAFANKDSSGLSDDDMEVENWGLGSSDDFLDPSANGHSQTLPLIPEGIYDAAEGVESFSRVFESRYGTTHPHFFHGSLDEAVKECFGTIGEKRVMALYLHHDHSVASNVFCSQILCSQQVSSFLNANFLVWPWDLTKKENRESLHTWANAVFGASSMGHLPMSLFQMPPASLPVLLLLTMDKSTPELLGRIGGAQSLDEVMMSLMEALEQHSAILTRERAEEAERQNREIVRMEQEQAYQESLAADRAKKDERQRIEDAKAAEEEKIRQAELELQSKRERLAAQLPEEPAADCGSPMAILRMRLPDGEVIERRFLASDKLAIFMIFVESRGLDKEKYRFLTSYPKRDLSDMDHDKSLEELKLCPREQITVEER